MTYPRWIMGDPATRPLRVPAMLREVAPDLYVGSERAVDIMPDGWATRGALVQLSASCNPVGMLPSYRWTFSDGDAVPGALLDDVALFVGRWRAKGPVLVQCQAGLSRSASVAYGLLRVLDGLDHAEALRRIETREEHYDKPLVWPRGATLESVVAWVDARMDARALVQLPGHRVVWARDVGIFRKSDRETLGFASSDPPKDDGDDRAKGGA